MHLYDEKDGLPVGAVEQVLEAPDGAPMAVAKSQLFGLHAGKWVREEVGSEILDEEIMSAFFNRKGTLLLATTVSVWTRAPGQAEFSRTKERGGRRVIFTEAPDGSVWIQTQSPSAPSSTRPLFSTSAEKPSIGIPGMNNTLLPDRDGFLWIGTSDGRGVIRARLSEAVQVTDAKSASSHVFDSFSHEDGLSAKFVTSSLQDHLGNIWFSTTDGLDRFRKPNLIRLEDKRFVVNPAITRCPTGEVWVGEVLQPLLKLRDGALIGRGPMAQPNYLYCDTRNVLWASSNNGLWRYGADDIRLVPVPPGIPPINTRQIVGDDEQQLFVSFTRNGLWRYSNGTWSKVVAPGLPDPTPYSLFFDDQKRLWVGYIDNRIALLDKGTGRVFAASAEAPIGMVAVMTSTAFGLVAGGSNGIAVLQGNHLQTLLARDEVSIRGVSGIVSTNEGDLWLNCLHGIVRIRVGELIKAKRDAQYRMLTEPFAEAGIIGPAQQVFGLPTALIDSQGVFWFSTSNKLVSVDPKAIHADVMAPILGSVSMTVDGDPFLAGHKVASGYHTVRIGYLGAYLSAPERVTYRYKLDGADTGWQDVGDRSEAVYTGLGPGAYRFQVQASSGDGVWSPVDGSLGFTISPAFYQRPLFVCLCVAATVCLSWCLFRLRVRRLAATIRQREEVRADERIRIARDLHDTLLQGVQGLTLRFNAAANELPDGSAARASLDNALTAADRLMLEGRNRVRRLRVQHMTHESFVEGFKTIGTGLNHGNQIRFQLAVEGQMSRVDSSVLGELYYIGQEAIINAFRHARPTEISATIQCLPKVLILTIADDGKGFDVDAYQRAPTADHWGVIGMQERASAMRGEFSCESLIGLGTKVILTVPGRIAYR